MNKRQNSSSVHVTTIDRAIVTHYSAENTDKNKIEFARIKVTESSQPTNCFCSVLCLTVKESE